MIAGKNVALVPFEEKHLQKTLDLVNNLSIATLINRVLPVASFEHRKWYEEVICDKTQVIFAIEDNNKKAHIGNCGLKKIDPRSLQAELWIYLEEGSLGREYGTEAIQLLVKYGFDFLNLNRIYLYLMDYNKQAQRAFERVGFKTEGRFRQHVFINGSFHDTIWMGLLRREFKV